MNLVSLWEMRKVETIEEFYKRKFDWMPDNIRNEIGYFNVFKLDPFVGRNAQPCGQRGIKLPGSLICGAGKNEWSTRSFADQYNGRDRANHKTK